MKQYCQQAYLQHSSESPELMACLSLFPFPQFPFLSHFLVLCSPFPLFWHPIPVFFVCNCFPFPLSPFLLLILSSPPHPSYCLCLFFLILYFLFHVFFLSSLVFNWYGKVLTDFNIKQISHENSFLLSFPNQNLKSHRPPSENNCFIFYFHVTCD